MGWRLSYDDTFGHHVLQAPNGIPVSAGFKVVLKENYRAAIYAEDGTYMFDCPFSYAGYTPTPKVKIVP